MSFDLKPREVSPINSTMERKCGSTWAELMFVRDPFSVRKVLILKSSVQFGYDQISFTILAPALTGHNKGSSVRHK